MISWTNLPGSGTSSSAHRSTRACTSSARWSAALSIASISRDHTKEAGDASALMGESSEPRKGTEEDKFTGNERNQGIAKAGCLRLEAKRGFQEDEAAEPFRGECGRYCCKRAAQRMTDKERFPGGRCVRDFSDAIGDRSCVLGKPVIGAIAGWRHPFQQVDAQMPFPAIADPARSRAQIPYIWPLDWGRDNEQSRT